MFPIQHIPLVFDGLNFVLGSIDFQAGTFQLGINKVF